MKLEETKAGKRHTYQEYCNRMQEKQQAAKGDVNQCLGIAFELWAASYQITADLSMQLQHVQDFVAVYGTVMPKKEQLLYRQMQQNVSDTYRTAELASGRLEREMADLMQKVFSEQLNEEDFFGGANAYGRMKLLWDGGELIEKLKEFIFVDGNAGRCGVKYILQEIG
ncbi:MAG: hypothetical protein K2N87_17370 [Eubacterium sp.]|nr:hypothetical protein [Eubacterium sp.]